MFSIIIPVKEINEYILKNLSIIENLDYQNYEIIVLPNKIDSYCKKLIKKYKKLRVVETGKVGPGDKRDLGAQKAFGEILVFLDDDSFPSLNLLTIAKENFKNKNVIAIGGPGITPRDSTFWEKVSGAVYLSKFSGGNPERYLSIGKIKEIDDWPSVNLMVRKSFFIEVNGFDSKFWPGEDTLFSLKLKKTFPKKSFKYVPNAVVWHYRRQGFLKHLQQTYSYGLHRGFFSKTYPETSLKIKYLLPSMFLLFNSLTIFNTVYEIPIFNEIYIYIWILYLLNTILALLQIIKIEGYFVGLNSIIYIFFTHIIYGLAFIFGLVRKELKSKLR
ncbi:glycosyltransferase [Alphaproteobacteria bacterium]|nr:glycosyltransferase [Alphaproteobacteria bacterium]